VTLVTFRPTKMITSLPGWSGYRARIVLVGLEQSGSLGQASSSWWVTLWEPDSGLDETLFCSTGPRRRSSGRRRRPAQFLWGRGSSSLESGFTSGRMRAAALQVEGEEQLISHSGCSVRTFRGEAADRPMSRRLSTNTVQYVLEALKALMGRTIPVEGARSWSGPWPDSPGS
jgi:hypothetical protein